jgi:PKD repeat protein
LPSLSVDFTDNSTGNITEQKWFFGDGTILSNTANPNHQFNNYGSNDTTFNVELIVATGNGCRDTSNATITVHPYINAKFTPDFTKGCADLDITLVNKSSGAINSYEWDWGDGSGTTALPNPGTHTYTNATDNTIFDTIQLVVDNAAGCTDTARQPIEIYPIADATFMPHLFQDVIR